MMSDLYRAVSDAEVGTEVLRVKPVEPCEHGNYAKHVIEDSLEIWAGGDHAAWDECDGKPKKARWKRV